MQNSVLVFGEILYDLFEEKAEIGGAPFNFAAHFASLGGKADLVSAVGKDALGHMASIELQKKNVGSRYVARTDLPTGYCKVSLDENGVPTFDLAGSVAYDHIPLPEIAGGYDALYFGTLAQRSAVSKSTLEALCRGSFREVFLDVNVRKPFYSRELLEESLSRATIVKISRSEAFALYPYTAPEDYCKTILRQFPNLRQIVLTLGKDGATVLDRRQGLFTGPTPPSKAISTVGGGDAFAACYLYHLLRGNPVSRALEAAVLLSDYVVTKLGAVPELPEELRQKVI